MNAMLAALLSDESGASMIEYALIVAVVAMGALAGAQVFGTSVSALFVTAAARVGAAPSTARLSF